MNYKNIIVNELKKLNMTLSIAESVTGGMISSTLVDIEGASQVFKGGVVTYTDEAKIKLINVKPETIEKHTAVSAQVAKEMALGVKSKLDTDFSIAVTGYAGPFQDKDSNQFTSSGEVVKNSCVVYFCIIAVDLAYEFEMTTPDEGRINNRITIASKIIEEFFKLIFSFQKNSK